MSASPAPGPVMPAASPLRPRPGPPLPRRQNAPHAQLPARPEQPEPHLLQPDPDARRRPRAPRAASHFLEHGGMDERRHSAADVLLRCAGARTWQSARLDAVPRQRRAAVPGRAGEVVRAGAAPGAKGPRSSIREYPHPGGGRSSSTRPPVVLEAPPDDVRMEVDRLKRMGWHGGLEFSFFPCVLLAA